MTSQTLRSRVTDFWRTLSSRDGCDDVIGHHQEPNKASRRPYKKVGHEVHHENFIQSYLNGKKDVSTVPEIRHGKSCYDLPSHKLAYMIPKVVASHTGPNQGLASVEFSQGEAFTPSEDVQFIDEATMPKLKPVQVSPEKKLQEDDSESTVKEVAGIADWQHPTDFACGIATTLYECNPNTKENSGEPIADTFGICVRENSAILALADGVNWGEKSCLAARCAVHGCMNYLNKALFSGAYNVSTTLDIFAYLLRSFEAAHSLIIEKEALLTTLCACVICPLEDGRYAICVCNVGDSFAYVFSEKHGVREVTLGSHDIFSMRDMRDALGALGPVDGINPELNNLTVSLTIAEEGDLVFLTSDGVSDNFDPVVGKFALAKRSVGHERKDTTKSSSNRSAGQANVKRSSSHRISSVNERNSLPIVEAHQRHELTLLRMEDLLRKGINGDKDDPVKDARELCERMIEFAKRLTTAKRRILEDPELYQDDQCTNRERRQLVCQKLAAVPGKLDHASLCAFRLGCYESEDEKEKKSIADARKAFFESSSTSSSLTTVSAVTTATSPERNNNLSTTSESSRSSSNIEGSRRSSSATSKSPVGRAPLCSFESTI